MKLTRAFILTDLDGNRLSLPMTSEVGVKISQEELDRRALNMVETLIITDATAEELLSNDLEAEVNNNIQITRRRVILEIQTAFPIYEEKRGQYVDEEFDRVWEYLSSGYPGRFKIYEYFMPSNLESVKFYMQPRELDIPDFKFGTEVTPEQIEAHRVRHNHKTSR